MSSPIWFKSGRAAISGSLGLLAVYFMVLTLVSGWEFTQEQFRDFWYFVLALAAGFGLQVGIYVYLKELTRHGGSRKVVAVSGATSTGAMIACCTHYLANLLPVLGATGLLALVAQYQVQMFWVALAINLAGVVYIGRRAFQASRHMAGMETHE